MQGISHGYIQMATTNQEQICLVSQIVLNHISNADISAFTDHCVASIDLIPKIINTERKSHWIFNEEYLKDYPYCSLVKKLICQRKIFV